MSINPRTNSLCSLILLFNLLIPDCKVLAQNNLNNIETATSQLPNCPMEMAGSGQSKQANSDNSEMDRLKMAGHPELPQKDTLPRNPFEARKDPHFLGNVDSMKFHKYECPYAKVMAAHRRIVFSKMSEACYAGMSPCNWCMPRWSAHVEGRLIVPKNVSLESLEPAPYTVSDQRTRDDRSNLVTE